MISTSEIGYTCYYLPENGKANNKGDKAKWLRVMQAKPKKWGKAVS